MTAEAAHKETAPKKKALGTFHTGAMEALVTKVATNIATGLTKDEAKKRLLDDGPNELPTPPPPNPLKQFFAQFMNPIVLTLLGAAVIAVVNGAGSNRASFLERYGDAIAIFLIVALNAVLGFYQERRAEAALDALKKMQTPNARVRRGDEVAVIAASELVVGDVLEIEAGDAVPADARIVQAYNLAAAEAALTGESAPVTKDARAELAEDAPLGDRANMLFVGTQIVRGRGRAVVVATAVGTELGKLSALMSVPRETKTPLEDKLDHFGKRILWSCLALSVALFAWGYFRTDRKVTDLLLEAVSLAVAAIPEGLPAITTITLALGMQRMASRGALIRKLAAVETLGAATVICTDKTGTLTQNEMTVREVLAGGCTYQVTGGGYDPRGEIKDEHGTVEHPTDALRDLLATAALANTAQLEKREDGAWRVVGDPTEGALLTLAAKGGVPRESVAPGLSVVREIPFDSDRKRMTVVTLDERGHEVAHTKGSADVLVPLCVAEERADGTRAALSDEGRREILKVAEEMSGRALRVLAIAKRELTKKGESLAPAGDREIADPPKKTERKSDGGADQREAKDGNDRPSLDIEQRLTFLGLVGMIDPPRAGVREAVEACREAQVRAVMITGDHKLTAVAIAKELGLWEEGSIALTGSDLEKLTDEALVRRIEAVRVFARVTAEQKLRIVRAFKTHGHIVAMTGDGVNDAPALREAHIGVAMGKDGTDVAREAADMVLADDNFATIVHAVREGRAIWRNIQKFIFFLLSSNAGLVVTVFVAALIPHVHPLTPLMILWINLVTNGLPALALGIDPPDPTQMMEPPRKASSSLLAKREWLGILAVGVVMSACAIACYLWPWNVETGHLPSFARAVAFSLLALSPLFHAFNCRSATSSIFSLRPLISRPLVLAVVLSAGIHLVAVLVPSLRTVFQTFQMDGEQWLIMLGLSAVIVPAMEIFKLAQRRGVIARDFGPMSHRR